MKAKLAVLLLGALGLGLAAAGARAGRLSDAPGPADPWQHARLQLRSHGAHHCRPAGGAARPAGHRGMRPGAGQTIAFGRIASGTPDGYTLIMMHSGHPIAGAMYKSLKYDTVNDFQMLSQLILYPFVLAVRQDHPLKSMAELIAFAKANPGKLSFSSTGVGTTQHLTGVLVQSKAGIETEPHLLSGRDTGRPGRAGWPRRCADRNTDPDVAVNIVGPDARHRGHHREGLADATRIPPIGGHRAGLRGERLDGRSDDP